MRPIRVAEDFVPISEFKAEAADWLRHAKQTGAPVVVTQNGKPAGVLLSPQAFDELTERSRFVESVERGLRDADAGRVVKHDAAKARLRARRQGA
jgi:prevent-host-death family protein